MRQVLSVGQCSMDHGKLSRAFREHFQAELTATPDAQSAVKDFASGTYDLVLINREFDEDGDSGLDFIQNHIGLFQKARTPIMLVSNFADAQASAVSLGAKLGIGKASLGSAAFVSAIQGAVPAWTNKRQEVAQS